MAKGDIHYGAPGSFVSRQNGIGISIGGVRFNKNDVAKSETTQKDGQTINTVFFKDGTKLSFPEHTKKDYAEAGLFDIYKEGDTKCRYNASLGRSVCSTDYEKTGEKTVRFEQMKNAEITGTMNKDTYVLKGCQNSKIELGHDDGQEDRLFIEDFGFIRSSGNEVFFGKGDEVTLGEEWFGHPNQTFKGEEILNSVKEGKIVKKPKTEKKK